MANGSNTCVCCGVDIPEGSHTCNKCGESTSENHNKWDIASSKENNATIEVLKLRAEINLVRQQNCVLVKTAEKLRAERDAAIYWVSRECETCEYTMIKSDEHPCLECRGSNQWKCRGIPNQGGQAK